MNEWTNRRLSEISPEEITALVRAAHQERAQATRALLARGLGWLAGLLREAGVAARLSEAPLPYPARVYPRTRLCG
jgi:hypothetical protein